MKDFTYENNDRKEKYEKYEWDEMWLEHADNLQKTRVLYIGDSISCQAGRVATALTEERILFDGYGTSKGIDNRYYNSTLKVFAQMEERRDVVLFNNGLHGWHLEDDTEYRFFYEETVKFLTEEFKGTPIIIVLTTVTSNEERNARVAVRNAVACEIADKYGLPVMDLCTPVKNAPEMISEDGVHLTEEGNKMLAGVIIRSIKNIVPDIDN